MKRSDTSEITELNSPTAPVTETSTAPSTKTLEWGRPWPLKYASEPTSAQAPGYRNAQRALKQGDDSAIRLSNSKSWATVTPNNIRRR